MFYSSYYSSKQPFTNGLTVRNWLSGKSFKEQYDFGMKTLKQFGWSLCLKLKKIQIKKMLKH